MKNLSGLFKKAAVVLAAGALLCSACTLANEPGEPITYTVSADGTADTANTTALGFAFSGVVDGLTAEDITVTGGTGEVARGALTGEDSSRSLGITVNTAGTLKVKITKAGIEDEEKTVTVHKAASGNDESNGADDGSGNDNDDGNGDGNGDGSGDGAGEGDGNGNGNGDGSGSSDDNGEGDGNGDDDGSGDDDGTGDGDDDGAGEGDGDDDGNDDGEGEDNDEPDTPAMEYHNRESEFDESAWTGQGSATEGWTLNFTEPYEVNFAVYKHPGKTISVSGIGNGIVIQAPGGTTVDGLTASDEEAVFTVKTGDLVFDGGERTFTLTVDDEALPNTVNVTIKVEATYETSPGASVFKLKEKDGNGVEYLERVDGDFTGLVDAFTWFENNAAANTEYTIRVEKDEVDVPYLVMGANGEDNVTLRFRGTKDGPKTLTPQYLTSGSGNHTIVNVQGGTYASGTTPGFITIGNQSLEKTKTFILGSNIKIQGHTRGTEHTNNYGYIFYLWDYGTLIMEPGAAIDGFKDTSGYIANTYNKLSYVRIEGGSITNCETYLTSGTYRGMIRFGSRGENQPSGVFYVAGGNALTVENCNPGVSKLVTFGNSEPHNVDLALGASLP